MALPLAELISAQRSVRPGLAQLRVLLFFWVRLPRFLAVDGPRRLYFTGSVFIVVRKKPFIVTNLARTNSYDSLIKPNI